MDLARPLPGVLRLTPAGESAWCAKEWEAFSRRTYGVGARSPVVPGGRNASGYVRVVASYEKALDLLRQAQRIYEGLAAQFGCLVPTADEATRAWQHTSTPPSTLALPDHRTPLEHKIGVDLAASGSPQSPEILCRSYTLGARLPLRRVVAAHSLAAALRAVPQLLRNLTKLAKTIARLRSLSGVTNPEPSEPPGQLVTASRHVTRGPTMSRTHTVLSAPRKLQLA